MFYLCILPVLFVFRHSVCLVVSGILSAWSSQAFCLPGRLRRSVRLFVSGILSALFLRFSLCAGRPVQ